MTDPSVPSWWYPGFATAAVLCLGWACAALAARPVDLSWLIFLTAGFRCAAVWAARRPAFTPA